jgi:hypothetical protein
VLQRVSINHGLGDKGAERKNILNFLRGNVLALGKLEDVFAAIDDTHRTIRVDKGDIASFEPSVLIKSIRSLVRSLVVTRGDG